eukprot:6232826-Pyramimonas_sp.AAC.1
MSTLPRRGSPPHRLAPEESHPACELVDLAGGGQKGLAGRAGWTSDPGQEDGAPLGVGDSLGVPILTHGIET